MLTLLRCFLPLLACGVESNLLLGWLRRLTGPRRFLAVDFDKRSWRDDAQAFVRTCRGMNLPAALERSRSGNGAHVWLFFTEPIPARLARALGSHILTETMEHHPEIGLDSYDRFFPNQDTLP